jgi:hypothetical protein
LNAMRNSNKSDMQELWRRMLHTRRTACMADARLLSRSLARLRNYKRKTSFGRFEHLVASEQVWEDAVLAARTCAWRSGAAEWTSEKTSLESLSSYSKLLRDVLDFNLLQISTSIVLQVSIWIILSGEF